MFRLLLALCVLMVCVHPDVGAQTTNEVILLSKGQQQSLPFARMIGAGVGDINVAFIRERKLNEVVIFGADVGETSLDIYHPGGRKQRLTVRVLPAASNGAQPQTRTAASSQPRQEAQVRTDRPGLTPEGVIGADIRTDPHAESASIAESAPPVFSARSPKEQAAAVAPATRGERAQAPRRSVMSRFEFSAETTAMFDREEVRVVSAELLEPGKLRAVVSADSVERLATSPQREQKITYERSAVSTVFSTRYELSELNSITVSVPHVRRRDEIKTGGTSIRTGNSGLGDVQVKFERLYPRLRKSAWDGTAEVTVGLPTGKSVYNVDDNQSPLGTGHYEVGGVFGARRVFDPLAFNAAAGVNYALPRAIGGTRIAPGIGYQAQTGLVYTVTDRIGLTQSLQFTRSPNFFLSNSTDAQTVSRDQAYLRHGVVFNPRGGHDLRVLFTLGMNPESMNHGFGVAYSFRRQGRKPE